MFKKIKNILLIGIPLIILIALIIIIINLNNKENYTNTNTNTNENIDGKRFKEEYEELNNVKLSDGKKYIEVNISSDNIIKYSTETEIINLINNKSDAIVYLGSPECNYCRSSVEVLLNTAKESTLNTIYYIDSKQTVLSNNLQNIINETISEDKEYSSLVIFINDGEIVSYNIDTLSSHKTSNKKLNSSQIEGLSEIYRYGIDDVITSKEIKDN